MKKSVLPLFLWFITATLATAQAILTSPPIGAEAVSPGALPVNIPARPQSPKLTPTVVTTTVGNTRAQATELTMNGFRRFDDHRLDSLIQLGLANSPNLKAALSRLLEARIRVEVATSFLAPSLRSSLLVTTQSLSERRRVPITTADQLPRFQLNTFQLLPIEASYELDLFKRIRNTVALTDLQAQASEADRQSFTLTLAAEIARMYLLIRSNDTEQAVFARNRQSRDSTLAIIQERFRVGLINQIDLQRAQTDYASLQVSLTGLQRARRELMNGLAQLCGQDPAQFSIPSGPLPANVPSYPYASVEGDHLRRRPDLVQFTRQNQAASAQVSVQQSTRLPRVSLSGSAGVLSGQLGPWFTPSSATYLVGINASVPLYEGHRAQQSIALANQMVQTSQHTYQQAYQLAQREAQTALDNLTGVQQQIELQQRTLGLARRTEGYNRELYVRGLTTYLEVLDAQRTVLASEQQLVQLRSQQAQYAVALVSTLGGDW